MGQDLNKMIDLVNFGGKKIVYMLKMGGFEMGPMIRIKWYRYGQILGDKKIVQPGRPDDENGKQNRSAYLLTLEEGVRPTPPTPPPATWSDDQVTTSNH